MTNDTSHMIRLTVDNRELEVAKGTTLLQACLENDIYIPNLCYFKDMEDPPVSCRMCFVEIKGENAPVASCSIRVREGMEVFTDTPAVRRLQRTALNLLLSVHHVECGKCPANKKCALQDMARFLKVGLKPKQLDLHLKEKEVDETHSLLSYHPNRCVLCGRCIHVCRQQNGRALLTFAERGLDTVISFYGEDETRADSCNDCHACVDICPVSALSLKEAKK